MRIILGSIVCSIALLAALIVQPLASEADKQAIIPLTPEIATLFQQQVQEVTPNAIIDPLTFSGQDGAVYRLAGIDVPDLYAANPSDIARQAKALVTEMLKGEKLKLYRTKSQTKGRSNRLDQQLVHVARYKDNAWVQGELVAKGLARVWPTPDNSEAYKELLALEDTARNERLGLWAVADYAVVDHAQADAAIGKFAVVRGKVISASSRNNMLFLNFGNDWKSDFTIGISTALRRDLAKKQVDIQSYAGKNIEVRGMVESYYGAFITLMDISQIRIFEVEALEAAPPEGRPDQKAAPRQQQTNKALHSLSVSPTQDQDLQEQTLPEPAQ